MMPTLPQPYDAALREAVTYLLARFEPLAIVASGTIIRGTPHASSDLDLVVIHDQPWRQQVQRIFHGVPAEMFVNPPFQVRRAFVSEARHARPVLAHMLATGVVVHDSTGITAELQKEARDVMAAGSQVDAAWLEMRRYAVATAFEDACDIAAEDPIRSRSIAVQALCGAVEWWFPAQGFWQPRSKDLFIEFERLRPELGRVARAAIEESTLPEMLDAIAAVLQATIGVTGFFSWETAPELLTP